MRRLRKRKRPDGYGYGDGCGEATYEGDGWGDGEADGIGDDESGSGEGNGLGAGETTKSGSGWGEAEGWEGVRGGGFGIGDLPHDWPEWDLIDDFLDRRWTVNDTNRKKDHTQSLMDTAYDKWRDSQEIDADGMRYSWSREEFLSQCSYLEKVAVCFGNMNYQVENGGWSQYVENHYASEETFDFLEETLEKFKEMIVSNKPIAIESFREMVKEDESVQKELMQGMGMSEEAAVSSYKTMDIEITALSEMIKKVRGPAMAYQKAYDDNWGDLERSISSVEDARRVLDNWEEITADVEEIDNIDEIEDLFEKQSDKYYEINAAVMIVTEVYIRTCEKEQKDE